MSSKNPFTTLVDETVAASLRLTQTALAQLPAQIEASYDFAREVLDQQRAYAVRVAGLVAESGGRAAA